MNNSLTYVSGIPRSEEGPLVRMSIQYDTIASSVQNFRGLSHHMAYAFVDLFVVIGTLAD